MVFEHIRDDDINYINKKPEDKDFHLDSFTWVPYLNAYSNIKKHEDGKYSVSIGAGMEDRLGYINLELPRINYPEFYQFETIEKLITHLTDIVDLTGAYMFTQNIFSKVADFSKEYDVEIGWMNYFKDKGGLNYLPSNVQQKKLPNGALFWLSDKITEPTEAMIQTAITIRNTLGEEGFLKSPTKFLPSSLHYFWVANKPLKPLTK